MPDPGGASPSSTTREVPAVERIGVGVPYLDGSEQHLLDIMRTAGDVSTGADELQQRIVDWPTRYHLAGQRANLLRPLRLRPGMRVLDVGAGTGSLARYLGEQGVDVTALEGNMARAEVAAVRCGDLGNVRVLCGSIDDLDPSERFDLVTIIGVLEYSVTAIGGAAGPAHLLDAARSRLVPGGAVALAIENQLGLKYLMGGAEDHRGVAWVGLEDYPGPSGARTWSRRELAVMLDRAGLVAQRWMYPFPDYKLPSIVLDHRLFDEPDAADLVEQLVMHPVRFWDHAPTRLPDAAAALKVLVRAGLGPDVASSFLVLAGVEPADVAGLADADVLAWVEGGLRRRRWHRHRRLTADRRIVVAGPSDASEGWLHQHLDPERPFVAGRTLGQELAQALRAHDRSEVERLLQRWFRGLEEVADTVDSAQAASAPHPFLRPATTRVLPDGHLDLNPSNFVDRDGELVLIDDEWRVGTPVDFDVVVIRALWIMSQDIVSSGIAHPWSVDTTVSEVFGELCGMVGLEPTHDQLRAFRAAELAMQQMVSGSGAQDLLEGWLNGDLSGRDVRPDELLRADRDELRAVLAAERAGHQHDRERLEAERDEMAGQVAHYVGLLAERDARIRHLKTPRGILGGAVRRVLRRRASR